MRHIFLRHRSNAPERLDETHHDPSQLRLNIQHLAGVNRWLGGERSIMSHLRKRVPGPAGDVIRVLDVGAGGADLPRSIARYLTHRSLCPIVFALDKQRAVADIAVERSNGVHRIIVLVGDGLALPLPDNAVDVAISSTTLHHLTDADAVRCVREMARVSRRHVIVGDLDRSLLALGGAHVLARTWWRRSDYRFDGPVSVTKAFNRAELLDVGREAGLRSPRVHRHFPFRLTLVGLPPE